MRVESFFFFFFVGAGDCKKLYFLRQESMKLGISREVKC